MPESISDLKKMLQGVISKMDVGFEKNQTSLESITGKVNDLTNSLEMEHALVKDLQEELTKEKTDKVELTKRVIALENDNVQLKSEMIKLKERVIDHENRNRRNCLEFEGIAQDDNESIQSLERELFVLFSGRMKINTDDIEIENCHRFGSIYQSKPRPVIVRFHSFKMRNKVWNNRKNLKGSRIFVNESFAPEVRDRRRSLWPYMKEAWKVNAKARLVVDKLNIEGQYYTYDKISAIPDIYKPQHTKTVDNVVLFFTKESPMSNHFKCKFTIDDVVYTSAEQFYVHKTAQFFGDAVMADEIMKQTDPVQHKRSLRKIKNYDHARWHQEGAKKVMKEAMLAKFSQNPDVQQFLINTGDKVIAESNPTDLYWGTGLSIWANDAAKKDQWKGGNQAGQLLMEVRDTVQKN
jgi:ribA/ribD-fused uncharacterized protein